MQKAFKTREALRNWFEKYHDTEDELWLVYFKKHTKKASVSYNEAVEEALCFGWIDGKVNRMDDERYRQRYTPRRKNSLWSQLNRLRSIRMMEAGKMTNAGLKKIQEAQNNGRWDAAYTTQKNLSTPEDLGVALSLLPQALSFFEGLSPSNRSMYVSWVESAKKPETRQNRIHIVVDRCAKRIKPGMV